MQKNSVSKNYTQIFKLFAFMLPPPPPPCRPFLLLQNYFDYIENNSKANGLIKLKLGTYFLYTNF